MFQANQTHYPSYQQELLGVVLALQEWRPYIEGSKKVTCITDHATLRHLTETENVTALAQRRFALWSDIISPYISVNADGSKSFEILYRKGVDNDFDALSRRPDLHYSVAKYEDLVHEADLELANEFFSSMCHLQIDEQVTQERSLAPTREIPCTRMEPFPEEQSTMSIQDYIIWLIRFVSPTIMP